MISNRIPLSMPPMDGWHQPRYRICRWVLSTRERFRHRWHVDAYAPSWYRSGVPAVSAGVLSRVTWVPGTSGPVARRWMA